MELGLVTSPITMLMARFVRAVGKQLPKVTLVPETETMQLVVEKVAERRDGELS